MTAILSPLRKDRITGSRLPAILGLSPYSTRNDVLREMVRQHFDDEPDFQGNIATEWGRDHELEAIAEYELTRQVMLTAAGDQQITVVHPEVDCLAVTPDGLIEDVGLAEAKCPFRAVYSHIREREDYFEQIQLELECTQRDWADFIVWRQDEPIAVSRVHHDPRWLASRMPEIDKFMAEYLEVLDSEKAWVYRSPLVDVRTDPEWELAALQYLDSLAAQKYAEKQVQLAKDDLVSLAAAERSSRGFGVLVTRSEPKGSVNYRAVAAKYAPDVDLEEFRSAPGKPVHTVRRSAIAV